MTLPPSMKPQHLFSDLLSNVTWMVGPSLGFACELFSCRSVCWWRKKERERNLQNADSVGPLSRRSSSFVIALPHFCMCDASLEPKRTRIDFAFRRGLTEWLNLGETSGASAVIKKRRSNSVYVLVISGFAASPTKLMWKLERFFISRWLLFLYTSTAVRAAPKSLLNSALLYSTTVNRAFRVQGCCFA